MSVGLERQCDFQHSPTFQKAEGIAEESWGEPGFIDSICQTTLISASASAFLGRNVMADRDVLSTQSEILYPEDSIFQGIIGASCQGEIWCSKSPDTTVGTWIY